MKKYVALDSHVLAVASVNKEVGDWAVYIGAVPGERHSEEWGEVAAHGTKLPREIGEFLFPEFKNLKWRY